MSTKPVVPIPDEWPTGTCDWGDCNEPSIDWRWAADLAVWLPVCDRHKRGPRLCVFCKVGNHSQCLGVTYRTSPDTAAWRKGERDGPPCECDDVTHVRSRHE